MSRAGARAPRLVVAPAPVPTSAPDAPGNAEQAVRDLVERGERLAEAVRRVRHAADEEAIHDLRVASRRFVVAGATWREMLRPKRRRALLRRVRKIRRRAGAARDLEVQLALVERVADDHTGAERDRLRHLKDRMVREWLATVDGLREGLGGRKVRKLGRRVEQALLAAPDRDAAWPDAVRNALVRHTECQDTATASLHAAIDTRDDAALHRARIAVKKWRYTLERLEAAGLASDARRLDTLREIQQALGDVQDMVTLAARVRETSDGDEPATQAAWARIASDIDDRRAAAVQNAARTIEASAI